MIWLPGIEKPDQYILLIWWETLEAHMVGFRESQEYQQWKELLHKFFFQIPQCFIIKKALGIDKCFNDGEHCYLLEWWQKTARWHYILR